MTGSRDGHDPGWQSVHANKVRTAAEAVSHVRPGQRVFVGTGCAQPQVLVRALTDRADDLSDLEIVHLLTVGEAPYAHGRLRNVFKVNSFFISDNVREVIQEGLGSYTPIFLSEIPKLFDSGRLPLDVALVQVSPPDPHGMCSLGISVDIVKSAVRNATMVIAEVNPQMPRTFGDCFVDVAEIDFLVPVDEPLLELASPQPTDVTEQIGEYVAALVEDGATIEVGIGKIPQAVLAFLKGKRDLGIHTEMITDSVVDLMRSGAVTGARKTMDKGRVVASFCMGTRKLYDYVHNNPKFAFRPTEHVNDPSLIGRQHRMTAINVALEVDLTGQVCADSLGTHFYSGIGGQVDFNRGAVMSDKGKAIIALPSTAHNGAISRIVTQLSAGAGVVTSRGDVHFVVTEHGVAYLHGKSIHERALALITIAHPSFRAQLLREAIEAKYLRPEMKQVEGRIHIGPRELTTTHMLGDGTRLTFRPIHPTDEPRVRDLFYSLSQQAIYNRFMQHLKRFPWQQIANYVYIDHRNDVAIVATPTGEPDEPIIAIGRYYLDPRTNRAEIAVEVRDEWQGKGLGTALLRYLTGIAKRNGIGGFVADVLVQNRSARALLAKVGYNIRSRNEGISTHFDLDFD